MGMLYLSLGLHRQQCNLPADVEKYVICGNPSDLVQTSGINLQP